MFSNDEIIGENTLMTEDEKSFLLLIYKQRLKFFLSVFSSLMLIALYSCGRLIYNRLLALIIIVGILLINAAILFYKRILSIKIDFNRGVKEKVFYTVTQKVIIDTTGQFFIGLNHPKHMFEEVSEDIWNNYTVGDQFCMYRTPKAKYHFNSQGKYSII